MSRIYFILGVIGWVLTPIVLLAYAFWPRKTAQHGDSKQKTFP
jgi:hypothetical protein